MMRIAWLLLVAALGAAPLGAASLELTLKRAVQLAMAPEGSARVQLSTEALKQAESRSMQARALLLPDLAGAFTARNQTTNLSAYGLRLSSPIPGFNFPAFVGPYSNIDARVSASQSVLDFSSMRRFHASKSAISAAKADVGGAGEQVAAQVARAYLTAGRTDAEVETAKANIALSEAVLKQAEDLKAAGTGTGALGTSSDSVQSSNSCCLRRGDRRRTFDRSPYVRSSSSFV
jgi:outer membrane protein TolC